MNENEVLKVLVHSKFVELFRLLEKCSMKLEFGEFIGIIYGKNREISICFKCKSSPFTLPPKDLCQFYWFGGLCLCGSCLEVIVDEWFERQ